MDLASFFKPKKLAATSQTAALKPTAKALGGASSELLSPASSPASEPAAVGTTVAPAAAQKKAPAATPKGAVATKKSPSDFFKPRSKQAPARPSPEKACAKKTAETEKVERAEEEPSIQSQGERLTTGDVVWAKYDDYPWWPCYLSADPDSGEWIDGGKVRVIFFGDDTEAWVSQRKVQPFLKNLARHRKDPQIQQALSDALNKLDRTDLMESAAQDSDSDPEEDEGDETGRSRRPRRATSQEKQRAAAKKILAANRPKRLKKSQPSDDEEDDLDLGLSGEEDEEEDDDGDDSGSEYGGSDSEEHEEEEADLSEGEPEDEDAAPPSEESEESEEEGEEQAKPQRKRKRVSFGAGTKGETDDAEDSPAVGRASIDALNEFACDTASSEAAVAKARQSKKSARSPPAASQVQKKGATSAAAASAAAPPKRGASAGTAAEEMDPSEWQSIAEQGDFKKARQVRFQQWMNTR